LRGGDISGQGGSEHQSEGLLQPLPPQLLQLLQPLHSPGLHNALPSENGEGGGSRQGNEARQIIQLKNIQANKLNSLIWLKRKFQNDFKSWWFLVQMPVANSSKTFASSKRMMYSVGNLVY